MFCRRWALLVASERHMCINQWKNTVTQQLEISQRSYQRLQCCCTIADFCECHCVCCCKCVPLESAWSSLRRGIPVTVCLAAQTRDHVNLGTAPLAGPSGADSVTNQAGQEEGWPDSNFQHIGADWDLGGGGTPFSKKKKKKLSVSPPL